jgi:thiamine transport system substrate-binding protein
MRRRVIAVVALLLVASCGSGAKSSKGENLTLVTHDAFAVTDSVLQAFTDRTGIHVTLVKGGDAGAVVNQAILTKDHPQGDVLYGIDNTLLSKGLDAGLFDSYQSPELANVDPSFDLDKTQHRVSPVDESDVCVNFDKTKPAPASLDDLKTPAFKDNFVVENPATSSTGLAFLLATVAKYGEDHYLDYWKALRDNGVKVDDGWSQAYDGDFTLGSGGTGTRPVVVSYATSPPADVVFADPPKTTTDVGVLDDACYRQIEFAGVLHGTAHAAAAHAFIDFMLSQPFQEDMPLQMYVYPVRTGAALPDEFTTYAVKPQHLVEVPQDRVAANREQWIKDWTATVIG